MGQPPSSTLPPRRGGKLTGIGVAVAVVLAAAALVVSLVRQPDESVATAPSSAPATSAGDTSAADKALCEEVAPLLREIIDIGKRFVALGASGTSPRDDGIPSFRNEVEDWAKRVQPIIDRNAYPPRFLTRTLQMEVDFKHLYAANIRPGPELDADAQAWNIAAIAYGGPYEVCHALGVSW